MTELKQKLLNKTIMKKAGIGVGFVIATILLPQIFHSFGAAGTVFLPMHIPVLLVGFLLGPVYGMAVGAVSPMISSYLTGMPQEFPVMPIMVLELATYGLVSGLLSKHTKLPVIVSLFIAMFAGRISYAVGYYSIRAFFLPEITEKISPVNALVTGIPGVLIQGILITIVVMYLKRRGNRKNV